jgi:hypothetical protein
MANKLSRNFSPRDDQSSPSVWERHTSLNSAIALNGAARVAQHLPCALIVEAGAADQVLQVTDVLGNVAAIVFEAAGTFYLRMSPAAIGGAATTVTGVTALYQTDPG